MHSKRQLMKLQASFVTAEFLVTDTHPLIHYFCGNQKMLSKRARQAFDAAVGSKSTSIFVPTPVLWELAMLVEVDAISLKLPFDDWVDELFRYPAIIPAPFEVETVKQFFLVKFHSDPFDRAIAATALQLELPLISNDGKMHEFKPCALYWD